MRARRPVAWLVCLALAAIGCSAIIDPDRKQLRGAGSDAGSDGAADASPKPCDGGCATGERCNPTRGCVPEACRDDSECNDALTCNGTERCAPSEAGADPVTGCVAGAPRACDDNVDCTRDSCDDSRGGCIHLPDDAACDDGVACSVDKCGGGPTNSDGCTHVPNDTICEGCFENGVCSLASGGCVGGTRTNCSDGSACTEDRCDESLGLCVHGLRDDDNDGFAPPTCAPTPGQSDCDDRNASANPAATELCNRRDDDCNGKVDDACVAVADTCDQRQTINLTAGRAVLRGTLSDFSSDYSNGCVAAAGRDAVYALAVEDTSDIVFDSEGSDARVVLAVSEQCTGGAFRGVDCSFGIGRNTGRTRLMLHRYRPTKPGALLYLLVDGAGKEERGTFSISVTVTPAKEDRCNSAMDIGVGGTVIGYASQSSFEQGSCAPSNRATPEGVFYARRPADGGLVVSAWSDEFAPVLYARAQCEGRELDCVVGSGGPRGASGYGRIQLRTDRDVWLFVDGATSGRYILISEP